MGIFNFFGIDVEVDLTGKALQEELAMGRRYLELDEREAGYDYENMTEEQEAEDRERSDIYCKLHYERGVEIEFPPHEDEEESKPWWKLW